MAKFQPGNQAAVGNGRPRLDKAFKERCRSAVDADVIQRWIDEVRNGGEQWVKCSELLAAYGYGKPSQAVEVTGRNGEPLQFSLSPEERLEYIERLRRQADAERASAAAEVAH